MASIECKSLSFSYQNKKKETDIEVFKDLNIKFESEKFNVLLGESGSGKTTLLNIISGIENQYDGELLFDGQDAREISIRRRHISYMPQKYIIYDKMTVFDNIAFPLRFVDITPDEVLTRVRNVAKRLGISQCLSRRPKNLSLGQQQRMVLAKALVKDPEIILLDEPMSSVDPLIKEELFKIIKEAKEELNATIIFVTHNYMDAIRYGDILYVLKDSQIVAKGTPKDLRDSKDEYLVYLKSENVMEDIK
ncbi:MAG: ABC transporter ATP-binding protein [Bacilli bacterium]|nr:ABC transporter ATP-binding protein [Bacilli bacterium]